MTYILFDDNQKIIGFADYQMTDKYVASDRDVVCVGSKFFYADETEAIAQAKAAEEEAARIASMQPTEQERLDAIEEMLLALAGGDE